MMAVEIPVQIAVDLRSRFQSGFFIRWCFAECCCQCEA